VKLIPLRPRCAEPLKDAPRWKLSDEARRDIEEIERHAIRAFPMWRAKP